MAMQNLIFESFLREFEGTFLKKSSLIASPASPELDNKELGGKCGSHGLDMEEDLNIVHLYRAYPAEK